MTEQTPAPGDAMPAADVDWDAEEARADEGALRGGLADRRNRPWFIGGVLAVVVLSLIATWFGISATRGVPHWVDTGFQPTSDSTIDVRFDLRRDPTRAVSCRLIAQEMSHAIVGRTEVTVPPSEKSPSRHIYTVKTAGPAVAGEVEMCWYTDEGTPR